MKQLLSTVCRAKIGTMMVMSLFTILALTSAYGQSTSQPVLFKVPFKFSAGGKTFPGGQYQINHEPKSEYVTIHDASGAITKLKVITLLAREASAAQYRIVFDKVGDAHFLSEVWVPGQDGLLVHSTEGSHGHESVANPS